MAMGTVSPSGPLGPPGTRPVLLPCPARTAPQRQAERGRSGLRGRPGPCASGTGGGSGRARGAAEDVTACLERRSTVMPAGAGPGPGRNHECPLRVGQCAVVAAATAPWALARRPARAASARQTTSTGNTDATRCPAGWPPSAITDAGTNSLPRLSATTASPVALPASSLRQDRNQIVQPSPQVPATGLPTTSIGSPRTEWS